MFAQNMIILGSPHDHEVRILCSSSHPLNSFEDAGLAYKENLKQEHLFALGRRIILVVPNSRLIR